MAEADKSDTTWLSKAARQAIKEGKDACQVEKDQKDLELQRQQRRDEEAAAQILREVPEIIRRQAAAGHNHAIVMRLKSPADYSQHQIQHDVCEVDQLRGVAAIVYRLCNLANLRPAIAYWHDGYGMESGFNIVVLWD